MKLVGALCAFLLAGGVLAEEKTGCLHAGPMLGYAELNEASVWVQTSHPCRVQLRYWKTGNVRAARLSDLVETNARTDHIARFQLTELDVATEYEYELYLDGSRLELPFATTLKTQPMILSATQFPSFRVAAGSCLYVDDPVYDLEPHAGGFEILDAIAAQRPDLMLWLGDNVYFRGADWKSEANMRARYRRDRAIPQLQRLLATTRNIAAWDDHDFGPNDSDGTFDGKLTAARIFRDYWMNGGHSDAAPFGTAGRFAWADAEFFLVDQRTFRSPNEMLESAEKTMLGPAQFQWLLESLRSSDATFKVVVGGGQMMNPMAPFEGWADFPQEQQRFIAALRAQRIEGVLFVSGDRHHTELIRRDEQGLYPLYDLTSSPLTSKSHEVTDELSNPARVAGTLVAQRNFCTLTFEGPGSDRAVVLAAHDTTGKQLWQRRIRAAELKFAKK